MKDIKTTFQLKKTILFSILGMLVCVGLDLGTKAWANRILIEEVDIEKIDQDKDGWENVKPFLPHGVLYRSYEIVVIDPYFTFEYTRNDDIGFSLLRGLDAYVDKDIKREVLKYLQLSAVLLVIAYFISIRFHHALALSFIIGGGLGNVIDRFANGYVTDFIKWSFPFIPLKLFNPWPIFNIADTCVTIGLFIFIGYFLFDKKPIEKAEEDEEIYHFK